MIYPEKKSGGLAVPIFAILLAMAGILPRSSPSVGRTTAKAAGCGFSKSRQRRPRPMLVGASTGPDSVTNDEIKSRCQLRGTKVSKTSSA